jgi:hypothetical protein
MPDKTVRVGVIQGTWVQASCQQLRRDHPLLMRCIGSRRQVNQMDALKSCPMARSVQGLTQCVALATPLDLGVANHVPQKQDIGSILG